MKDEKTIVLWETPWCPNTNGKQKKYRKKIITKTNRKTLAQIKQRTIKETKTRYEWKKTKKKQVEGEGMLIEACKIKLRWNISVAIEEEKLIIEKNAMKSKHQKMREMRIEKKKSRTTKCKECNEKSTTSATKCAHWKEGTQEHQNERMQWKASNICCKKCALKRGNTRIEKLKECAMKS